MAVEDQLRPELAPDDLVQFVEYHRPRLKSGDYTITVRQKIDGAEKKDDPATPKAEPQQDDTPLEVAADAHFSVAGERFKIAGNEIHSVFPPATHGAFHRVLPHVILSRDTLPWERSPRGDDYDEVLSPSWLALLLFVGDDEVSKIDVKTVRVAELTHEKVMVEPEATEAQKQAAAAKERKLAVTKKEWLAKPSGKEGEQVEGGWWRTVTREVTQHGDETVSVIDVPWKLLEKVLPTYEDLRVLAHTRKVRHKDPEGHHAEVPPEVAVVFGNRLPPHASHCVAHLVSLEGRYTSEEHLGELEVPYALEWDDHHDTFAPAGQLKGLLEATHKSLDDARTALRTRINAQSSAEAKHALERLEDRLTAELRIVSGEGARLLTPMLDAALAGPVLAGDDVASLLATGGDPENARKRALEQLDESGRLRFGLLLKGVGTIDAEVFEQHGRDHSGRLSTHLAATLSIPPPPETLPTAVSSDEQGQVRGWLADVAKRAGVHTLVLEAGKRPYGLGDPTDDASSEPAQKVELPGATELPAEGDSPEGDSPGSDSPERASFRDYAVACRPELADAYDRRQIEFESGVEVSGLTYTFHLALEDGSEVEVRAVVERPPRLRCTFSLRPCIELPLVKVTKDDTVAWAGSASAAAADSVVELKLAGEIKRAQTASAAILEIEVGRHALPLSVAEGVLSYPASQPSSDSAQERQRLQKEREDLLGLSKQLLPDLFWQRARLAGRAQLTRWAELGTEHVEAAIRLNGAGQDAKPTQRTELVVTLRHATRLYFDHLGAKNSPDEKLRLVSLKSWAFDCDKEGKDFLKLLESLDGVGKPAVPRLEKPDIDAKSPAGRFLQAGYVPLPHRLRQGDRTISWYRGPLIPRLPEGGDHAVLHLPARGPDELLILHKEIGMLNASYAAAWELGRMMALADESFATRLHQWKQSRRHSITATLQSLDHGYLPIVRPPDAGIDLPQELGDWLDALTRLEGVPFNYLVPDEELLPKESIRFFTVDPLWLECLRDGALAVGRVLQGEQVHDTDTWEQIERPPRISGFLMRSAVVSGWPGMAIVGYHGTKEEDPAWRDQGHLEDKKLYHQLKILRRVRLSPDLMLCLFYDPTNQYEELNLLECHLHPQVLHFGLEEGDGDSLIKVLRNPGTGDQLTLQTRSAAVAERHVQFVTIDQRAIQFCLAAGVEPQLLHDFLMHTHKERSKGAQHPGVFQPLHFSRPPAEIESEFKAAIEAFVGQSPFPQFEKIRDAAVPKKRFDSGSAAGDSGHATLTLTPEAVADLAGSSAPAWLVQLEARLVKPFSFEREDAPEPEKATTAHQVLNRAIDASKSTPAPASVQPEPNFEIWKAALKSVDEAVDLGAPFWREKGVLDPTLLFHTTADLLAPVTEPRAVTSGDFGLQMLDGTPMMRFFRH